MVGSLIKTEALFFSGNWLKTTFSKNSRQEFQENGRNVPATAQKSARPSPKIFSRQE
jgi:hypothetical protein